MLKKLTSLTIYSFLSTLLLFIFQTLATHVLSIYDYGILAKWLTDFNYTSILFVLGLDISLIYFINDRNDLHLNIYRNFIFYTFISVILISIVLIFQLKLNYFGFLILGVFFFSIINIIRSKYQYDENFKSYSIVGLIRPILLTVAFLFFYASNIKINSNSAIALYIFILFITLLVVGLRYWSSFITGFKKNISKKLFEKEYFIYGIRNVLNKFLSISLYASTIYCLSYLENIESVGLFFVASSISRIVWIIPDSAGNILLPKFLKVSNKMDHSKELEVMYYFGRLILILNIMIIYTP